MLVHRTIVHKASPIAGHLAPSLPCCFSVQVGQRTQSQQPQSVAAASAPSPPANHLQKLINSIIVSSSAPVSR